MKTVNYLICSLLVLLMASCKEKQEKIEQLEVDVYETSASGNKLTKISEFSPADSSVVLKISPEKKFV